MGLDIMLNTNMENAEYDNTTRQWSVQIEDKDGKRVIKAKHVVMATGLFSTTPVRPEYSGEDSFKGLVYHTIEHKSAGHIPDLDKKNVTIIGCATSAHDIAQDFVNHGAKSVSMIQRHPIWSVSTDSIEKIQLRSWNTLGVTTEEEDLLANSFPTAIVRTLGIGMSQMMVQNDKELMDGLDAAGLALKRGEDGQSLIDYQLIKGGHFYIDQGASQMIIDGRIKVHRCEEGVKQFYPQGLILGDDRKIDSDVVVVR